VAQTRLFPRDRRLAPSQHDEALLLYGIVQIRCAPRQCSSLGSCLGYSNARGLVGGPACRESFAIDALIMPPIEDMEKGIRPAAAVIPDEYGRLRSQADGTVDFVSSMRSWHQFEANKRRCSRSFDPRRPAMIGRHDTRGRGARQFLRPRTKRFGGTRNPGKGIVHQPRRKCNLPIGWKRPRGHCVRMDFHSKHTLGGTAFPSSQ